MDAKQLALLLQAVAASKKIYEIYKKAHEEAAAVQNGVSPEAWAMIVADTNKTTEDWHKSQRPTE